MIQKLHRLSEGISKPAQQFLKTDIRYLASGSFWLTVGKVASMGVAFVLSVLYARYLSKELYGDYRYILSVIGMFTVFSLSDIGVAITRAVARGKTQAFRRGTAVMFFSSFGMTIATLGAAVFFGYRGTAPLAWGFAATALLIPFVEGLGTWHAYLDGKKQFRQKTIYNIASQIFYGTCMTLTVVYIYMAHTPPWISLALLAGIYYLAHALPNIFLSLYVMRSVPASYAPQEEQDAIRYGVHLSLIKIPTTIANYIDSVLLYTYLGGAQLALYSFALAPTEQIKALLGNAASVGFPKLSEKTSTPEHMANLKKTLPVKMLKASLLTSLIVILYILAAPLFFQIFFPRYTASVAYSQIIALSLAFFPLNIFGTALKAEGDLKKIYIFQVAPPIVQILLFLLLIPSFHLWGAVIGKVAGRLTNHLIQAFLYMRT
ncbi:MAG: hypothetical protein A2756_00385 [Candidatus Ryanbacteria bacterium RIFCSPHIGHO2_01_FULL_48_27]|uniref:Polysaccharide biosynthesis protein C-terminal domain-containing protein n=1 Tax=Candidatus Ryanbacteria bacterium RIFCSPHIGHO2_01_FULL_48_27 TaxID=1802115 RepID=A0A1G2G5V4_9BACT|nr:MAG: hypothetical protein A2756_00385 [Candidatus Ryanbacteria bacterium RIFCSPHIGHO2_01_FULL_48_27]